MNSVSLKSRAKNIAKEKNITVNEVLQNYMFERLLERISISKYQQNFILKGGFLLSSILGLDSRTTIDLDTSVTGIPLSIDKIVPIIEEIINIAVNDNIKFSYDGYETIIENSIYTGLKIKLTAYLENMRQTLRIDIATTGDIITPKALQYDYKLLFEDRVINIYSYNIETILAEKLHSIVENSIFNSRMKDYYDIYYLVEVKWNEINLDILKQAIYNTFRNRNKNINQIIETFSLIKDNLKLEQLFNSYKKAHSYVIDVSYRQVIENIQRLIDIVM